MQPERERIRKILTGTVVALCRSGLEFDSELRVEGLLGITLDQNEVFLVNIKEIMTNAQCSAEISSSGSGEQSELISPNCRRSETIVHDSQISHNEWSPHRLESKTQIKYTSIENSESFLGADRQYHCNDDSVSNEKNIYSDIDIKTEPPDVINVETGYNDSCTEQSTKVMLVQEENIDKSMTSEQDFLLGVSQRSPFEERHSTKSRHSEIDAARHNRDAVSLVDNCGNDHTCMEQGIRSHLAHNDIILKELESVPPDIDASLVSYTYQSSVPSDKINSSYSPETVPGKYRRLDNTYHSPAWSMNLKSNFAVKEIKLQSSDGSGNLEPWPDVFEVPEHNFPPQLLEALDNGEPLNRSLKGMLWHALFREMTKFVKHYPKPAQYNDVAKAIVARFPSLRDSGSEVLPYETIKQGIIQKWKNERRSLREEPVLARKRKLHTPDRMIMYI